MSYKTTNDLMQHLRDNGIAISGETQKQQLVTTGYYHGYKGYRFFKSAGARLPFSSYQELYATIQYDSALKALFYGKMMFIETAVKNIALQGILENAQSGSISDVLDRVVCSYNNSPANFTVEQKKRAQQNKLNLQRSIQSSLANAYAKGNPKIHPNIKLYLHEQKYEYEITAVYVTDVANGGGYYNYLHWNTRKEQLNYLQQKMAGYQIYDTGKKVMETDELLSLSTCEYSSDNGRLIVQARRKGEMTDGKQII